MVTDTFRDITRGVELGVGRRARTVLAGHAAGNLLVAYITTPEHDPQGSERILIAGTNPDDDGIALFRGWAHAYRDLTVSVKVQPERSTLAAADAAVVNGLFEARMQGREMDVVQHALIIPDDPLPQSYPYPWGESVGHHLVPARQRDLDTFLGQPIQPFQIEQPVAE